MQKVCRNLPKPNNRCDHADVAMVLVNVFVANWRLMHFLCSFRIHLRGLLRRNSGVARCANREPRESGRARVPRHGVLSGRRQRGVHSALCSASDLQVYRIRYRSRCLMLSRAKHRMQSRPSVRILRLEKACRPAMGPYGLEQTAANWSEKEKRRKESVLSCVHVRRRACLNIVDLRKLQ